jgi:NADPH-dependent 2,4-dienoyl-CoA reductase/sulfur reductase-like enzyme
MGRCQGGFCTPRLIELLGEELGLPPDAFLSSRKKVPEALKLRDAQEMDQAGSVWDVAVIGAGPAGLAAACAAKEAGAEKVLVLERDDAAGGILQQCIHNGFGLHRFKEELTGPEYAKRFVDKANELAIPVRCGTMVVGITPAGGNSKTAVVTAMSRRYGLEEIKAKSVVLAMGCRERPRGALMTPGTRPAGVYTAGTVQRLVNMDGIMPGNRVVILGSGDIGLIMARRLTFQGAKVLACVEIMQKSSGLTRNVVQCLNDFDIPLLLRHTVVDVEGREHVTGVKVAKVDEDLKPIAGTEIHFECDTLLLSCGLIPENELSKGAGVEIDPKLRGPKVDANMATSVPGIFAGGNVVKVYDLVDWVSRDSEIAGRSAAEYAKGVCV